MDPNSQHSAVTDNLRVAFSKMFRGIGDYRHPVYSATGASTELLEMRSALCGRRIEFNRWCMVLGNLGAGEHKPDCIAFWEVVARNASPLGAG